MAFSYREFLKPNRRTVTFFIILAVLSFYDLYMLGSQSIPCLKKPLVAPDIEVFWKDSMCSLGQNLLGVSIQFTWLSWTVVALLVLVLPYLIACLLDRFVFKKKRLLSCIFSRRK